MIRRSLVVVFAILLGQCASAETLLVPENYQTLQSAIDAAQSGDTILVTPGVYQERIRLISGITLRSRGDDSPGSQGLLRAEVTIIDGGQEGQYPGVVMAEGSTLDGFTITNVGLFDEVVWNQHFSSHGDELEDEEGAVQAEGTVPAVSIQGVNCIVTRCLVHHNGDVGIAVLGSEGTLTAPLISENFVYRNMGGGIGVAERAEPIIRANTCMENLRAGIGCRNANPLITQNICSHNIRAGIGCREEAKPLIRENKCFKNQRAGIGIRMAGTAPVVEDNECYANEMAGIGCRDGAEPILRGNRCYQNKQAGIGCRNSARPLIVGNTCRENEQAGIGADSSVNVIIHGNKCIENKMVAIGITDKSTAWIVDNELSRSAGVPPLIAVRQDSVATIRNNRITGGGVAAILVQGQAVIESNHLRATEASQRQAIWIREAAVASIVDNFFEGYSVAVNATNANVVVSGNTIKDFLETAIVVKNSRSPTHIYGNRAISASDQAKVVDISGAVGIVQDNLLRKE
jgi:parallel beta-helix repeat protein